MMAAEQTKLRTLDVLLEGLVDADLLSSLDVSGVCADSRLVSQGVLFLARAGMSGHGLDYVTDTQLQQCGAVLAEESRYWSRERIEERMKNMATPCFVMPDLSDAATIVAARFYDHPAQGMRITGITGTNGKSTCVWFMSLLGGSCAGMIGTLGSGRPDRLLATTHTTPDSITLQQRFFQLRNMNINDVAMEVSSHALVQGRIAGLQLETAIFTNLSRDHLDYHGDMDAYGAAKQRLFQNAGLQHVVVNIDDPFAHNMLKLVSPGVERAVASISRTPDELRLLASHWICATDIELTVSGCEFQLRSSWGDRACKLATYGRFNISNLLEVAAARLLQGMPFKTLLSRFRTLTMPPGRLERFTARSGLVALVDYAHTPDALESVLGALREHCAGRLIVVFGCGGDRDTGKRPLMGEVAERLAQHVIVTDDNPRNESPERIVDDILKGMRAPAAATVIHDRRKAISTAIDIASDGDMVLVAGKGHETMQLIGSRQIPFSDRETVRELLDQHKWGHHD